MWNAREMDEAAKAGDSVSFTLDRGCDLVDAATDWPLLPQDPTRQRHHGRSQDHKATAARLPIRLCPQHRGVVRSAHIDAFAAEQWQRNRILFAPVPERERDESPDMALRKWVNCTRLAVWETARLNELFTGTMLGLRGDQFCQSPLQKGRFEESVEVMLPGDTDWRRAFLVVQDHSLVPKQKKRLSFLPSSSSSTSVAHMGDNAPGSTVAFYATRKSKRPFFTFNTVRHVAAIYPENQKMIPSSAAFKVEGFVEWDTTGQAEVPAGLDLQAKRLGSRAAAPKAELWETAMVMPGHDSGATNDPQVVMLTCILAICDVFKV
jgi:hypothetical protein